MTLPSERMPLCKHCARGNHEQCAILQEDDPQDCYCYCGRLNEDEDEWGDDEGLEP